VSSSTATIRAWPFLVARGRREGYRTLLAPRFLIDGDLHETLSDATPSVAVGSLGRVDLPGPGAGSLGLTYTTEEMSETGQDISAETGTWTDEHGRPLEMLYGVVARHPLSPALTLEDLHGARQEALQAYRRFLTDEDGFAVCESRSMLLPGEPAPPTAPRMPEPPRPSAAPPRAAPPRAEPPRPTAAPRRHRAAAALVAAAAVIAALLIWMLAAPGGPAKPVVTIVSASATPLNGEACSGPGDVSLQAQVTTNRPVTLAYRWVPASALGQGLEHTITVGSKAASISDVRPAQPGPYRLVIDKPVRGETGPVQCQPSVLPIAP